MFGWSKDPVVNATGFQDSPRLLVRKPCFCLGTDSLIDVTNERAEPTNFPMLGNISKPFDSRMLQFGTRVEPSCDGLVDDRLLLLVQQGDELLLGPDVPPDEPIGMVEEANDGGLFGKGRNRQDELLDLGSIDVNHSKATPHRRFLMSR